MPVTPDAEKMTAASNAERRMALVVGALARAADILPAEVRALLDWADGDPIQQAMDALEGTGAGLATADVYARFGLTRPAEEPAAGFLATGRLLAVWQNGGLGVHANGHTEYFSDDDSAPLVEALRQTAARLRDDQRDYAETVPDGPARVETVYAEMKRQADDLGAWADWIRLEARHHKIYALPRMISAEGLRLRSRLTRYLSGSSPDASPASGDEPEAQ